MSVRARGLSELEAARRLAEHEPYAPAASRSYVSIVRANVFTVFNLILAVAGAATLAFGEWQDALFLGVLLSNSAIGITQEVRAKRALDRLAALVAPTAAVVRDGATRVIPVEEVVEGDLIRLQPGDQLAADGELVRANSLALDESILTGESRPVVRSAGERARARARSSSTAPASWWPTRSEVRVTPRGSQGRRARSGTRARRSSVH